MKAAFASIMSGAVLAALAVPTAAQTDVAAVVADSSRQEANRAQDESRQPAVVLEFAGIERGADVADVLAGGGYFSEMLSRVVGPRGKVYVMNPPGFHDAEAWAAITPKRRNISLLVAQPDAMQLAPRSLDAIFTHMTWHDLYWESEQFNYSRLDVPSVLANWHIALRPGGTVIVVDHLGPAGDPRDVVERLHRIDPARVIEDMQRAGFELVDRSDALQNETDNIETLVFDPTVRGKTSRFMLKFRRN